MMTPNINGNLYGHTSITVTLVSQLIQITGIKEISYSQKLDPGKAYGTGIYKLGRTVGQLDASGSMTLLKSEADQIRTALGFGYMRKPWDLSISYGEDGSPLTTDQLFGIRITNEEITSSSGNEPIHVKWDLDIMSVWMGGFDGSVIPPV